jgi:GMP synthase PP-ATPase subunit
MRQLQWSAQRPPHRMSEAWLQCVVTSKQGAVKPPHMIKKESIKMFESTLEMLEFMMGEKLIQNTIYTDEEYMAQGFTAEECPKIRRHDELFNRYQQSKFINVEPLTDEEMEEMYRLAKELDL